MRGLSAGLILLLSLAKTAYGCAEPPWSQTDLTESIATQNGTTAWYSGATREYGHGVLGDLAEGKTLHLWSTQSSQPCGVQHTLDASHVFEDITPRIMDLDGDDVPELITIRAHQRKGAQIAIYRAKGNSLNLIATTDYIGTRYRWLAPAGIADFDGDGAIDIAFVDRPHLAKTLRLFRFENDQLTEWRQVRGVTNHKIGWPYIAGGLRDCGQGPEIVLADARWQRVLSLSWPNAQLASKDLGPYTGPDSLTKPC
ncbi:MAG: VCBS repeat-containing protein [Pseudomonadota bacterium]